MNSTLRIHIPLTTNSDTEQVINLQKLVSNLENSQETYQEEQESLNNNIPSQKRKRLDPEDDYDLNDNWIDDSDLYYTQECGDGEVLPVGKEWDFGFFAWKGDVSQFLSEHLDKKTQSSTSKRDRGKRQSSVVSSQPLNASVKKIKTKTPNVTLTDSTKKTISPSKIIPNTPSHPITLESPSMESPVTNGIVEDVNESSNSNLKTPPSLKHPILVRF